MISVEEAIKILQENLPSFKAGTVEVRADRNYPPFHRVMMDGIALRYEDFMNGKRIFPIEGVAPAGEAVKTLKAHCLEVMTGAPLPINADLVIPYEHLSLKENVATITVEMKRERFDSVHLEGSDCKRGEKVLPENLFWNGPRAGIAASMGYPVSPLSPKIMIITTGDELVDHNPLPHQLRRSNSHALKTSLEINGFSNVVIDHLKDDPKLVMDHYIKHASDFDILIYSGGVSKGKFDYLPSVWADLGVKKYFHEISQRPGKPLWFGVDQERKTVVFGLPGNPVSCLVCLHRYFIPDRGMKAKITKDITFKKPLTYFVPVKIHFDGAEIHATPLDIKNSGEFTGLGFSDGFIELPKDQDHFPAGDAFKFFPWRSF